MKKTGIFLCFLLVVMALPPICAFSADSFNTGTTFNQSDLVGTWRMYALLTGGTESSYPGGVIIGTGWSIATVSVDASGLVTPLDYLDSAGMTDTFLFFYGEPVWALMQRDGTIYMAGSDMVPIIEMGYGSLSKSKEVFMGVLSDPGSGGYLMFNAVKLVVE